MASEGVPKWVPKHRTLVTPTAYAAPAEEIPKQVLQLHAMPKVATDVVTKWVPKCTMPSKFTGGTPGTGPRPGLHATVGEGRRSNDVFSTIGGNHQQLAINGDVPLLVRMLQSGSTVTQQQASDALRNVISDPEKRALAVEAGAIPALVALLQSGTALTKEKSASILFSIASDSHYTLPVANAACMPLVNLLRSGTSRAKEFATGALRKFSFEPEGAALVTQSGGILPLVELMQSGTDRATENTVSTLWNIARNAGNCTLVVQAGAISPLVELLQSYNERIQHFAAGALGRIAANEGTRALVVDAGALPPLVELLLSSNVYCQGRAAETLANIAFTADFVPQIVEAGAISPLTEMLELDSEFAMGCAAFALDNIVINPDNAMLVIQAGAIPLLVEQLDSDDVITESCVRDALWAIADNAADKSMVAQEGVIPPLVKIVQRGTTSEKAWAISVLRAISEDPCIFPELPHAELVGAVILALKSNLHPPFSLFLLWCMRQGPRDAIPALAMITLLDVLQLHTSIPADIRWHLITVLHIRLCMQDTAEKEVGPLLVQILMPWAANIVTSTEDIPGVRCSNCSQLLSEITRTPDHYCDLCESSCDEAFHCESCDWDCCAGCKGFMNDTLCKIMEVLLHLAIRHTVVGALVRQHELFCVLEGLQECKVPEIAAKARTFVTHPSVAGVEWYRSQNRWGAGLELVAGNLRPLFPSRFERDRHNLHMAITVLGGKPHHWHLLYATGRDISKKMSPGKVNLCDTYAMAIYTYTEEDPATNLFGKLQGAYQLSTPITDEELDKCRDYLYHVDRALSALPDFCGKAYRVTKDRFPQEVYVVGQTITWQPITSVTCNLTEAVKYLNRQGESLHGSLFILNLTKAKDIHRFSAFPFEKEAVLRPNSVLYVTGHLTVESEKKVEVPSLASYNMSGVDIYLLDQL